MSESFLRSETLGFLDSSGPVTTLTSSKIAGPPDISFLELTGVSSSDGLQFGLTSDIQSQLYFKNATNTDFGFVRHTPGELSVQSNNLLTVGGNTLRFGNATGAYIWPNTAPTAVNDILQVASIDIGQQEYTLEWVANSGGGGTPGGSTTNVQFNNAGSFGGEPEFSWDPSNNRLLLAKPGSTTTPFTGQPPGFQLDYRSDSTTADFAQIGMTSGSLGQCIISMRQNNFTTTGDNFFISYIPSTGLATLNNKLGSAGIEMRTEGTSAPIRITSVLGSLFLNSTGGETKITASTDITLQNSSGIYTWPTVFPSANQVLSAGSTPGTLEWINAGSGTTYEFLQAGLNTTTAVPANAAAVPFDTTLANNGGITRSSGVFTLEANKTYKLTGALRTNIAVTADITYQWRDITNNILIGTVGSTTSYTSTSNFSVNSIAQAFLSTTAATTVHLEIITGGSVGQLDASNCFGTIETQIAGSGGGGGGSPPGGIDGSLQFKAGTSFDGNNTLLWDTANNRLLVAQQGSTTTPVTGIPTPNPFILDVRNTTNNDGAFINIQGTAASASGFIFSDSTTNAPNFFFLQSPVSSVLSAQTPFFLSSQSEVTVESSGDLIFKNSNATPYTWPTTAATANQVLSAGSSPGTMEWVSFNGTPGGSTTNVQFNNAGTFDGTDQFSWDPSNATEPRLLLSKNASDIVPVAPPPSPTPDDFILDVRNDTGNCWVGLKAADRGGLYIQDPSNTILGLLYYNTNALLLESTNVLIQSSRLDFDAANTSNGILYTTIADGVTNSSDFSFDNAVTDPLTTSLIVKNTASTASTIATVTPLALSQLVCNGTVDSNSLLQLESGTSGQAILVLSSGGIDKFTFQHNSDTAMSSITTVDSLNIEASGTITMSSSNPTILTGASGKLLVEDTAGTPPTVPSTTLMQLHSSTTARLYINYSGASSFGEINISDSSSLGLLISHTRGTESLILSQERIRISANDDIIFFNGPSDSISLTGGGVSIESVNSDLSFTNNLQTVKWPTNTPTENSVLTINNTSSPYTSEWRAPTSGQIFEARMINQLTTGTNIYTIQSPSVNTTSITLSTNTLTITEPGLYQFTAIWAYTTGGNFNAFKFYNSTTAQFFGPFAFEGDGSTTLITNLEITGTTNIQVRRDPSVPAAPNNFDGFAFPRGSLIIQRLSY